MSSERFGCREESDLATAWAKGYLHMRSLRSKEIAPFAVSIHSPSGIVLPDSLEHPMVRALDTCLQKDGEDYQTVEMVAFTLFPERLWKLSAGDRLEFYREAMRNLRTFTTWEPTKNRGGLYYGRLFGFGVDHRTGRSLGYKAAKAMEDAGGNQVEHVIRQLTKSVEKKRSVARMQLQAATFDPLRDLTTSGQPSFPCLQHIAFNTDIENGCLELSAFYATQQLYVKAYGNWLGLCRLGAFIAEQSGLKLTRFTCFANVQKMDKSPKAGPERAALLQEARVAAGLAVAPDEAVIVHG
jgi:thymidylate synthase